ncbi:hypothetical protein J7E49_12360 [Variovorax paradoxus]|nr:hypothetical protein [Variovorax paradoxus]
MAAANAQDILRYGAGDRMNFVFFTSALLALVLFANPAFAASYHCTVEHRFSEDRRSPPAELERLKPTAEINEGNAGNGAVMSRCSFEPSVGKVTCDRYPVDHIAHDTFNDFKKFYVFRSQFDLQIFRSLRFVENNGRGGIATGTCTINH